MHAGLPRFYLAATPKFEVKRHRAAGHSNDCMAVSLRRYSALNFAGCAIFPKHRV